MVRILWKVVAVMGCLFLVSSAAWASPIPPGSGWKDAQMMTGTPPTRRGIGIATRIPPKRGGLIAETPGGILGNRLIIELTEPALASLWQEGAPRTFWISLALSAQQGRIEAQQTAMIAILTGPEIGAVILGRTMLSMNSISVEVDRSKLELIRQIPGVKAIYPVRTFNRDMPIAPVETPGGSSE